MIFKSICFLVISFVSSFCVYNIFDSNLDNNNNDNNVEDITVYSNEEVNNNLNLVSNDIETIVSTKGNTPYVEKELLILEIPKINIKNKIYQKNSSLNDIDKNVQIMNESDMPNVSLGNVILGGHSGSGPLAYFKNLNLLSYDDEIIIHYNKEKYLYHVKTIYTDDKNGSIIIRRNYNKDTLTLFTCNPGDKNSYLIIIAEKV